MPKSIYLEITMLIYQEDKINKKRLFFEQVIKKNHQRLHVLP